MIGEVRDVIASLGQEAVDDIRQSAFGRLFDFDRHARLSGVILHQIIARQFTFRGIGPHKAWFRIGNESICFGKKEFCLITGLKFGTLDFDPNMVYTPREDGLWKKVFKGAQILPKHLWDMIKTSQFNDQPQVAVQVALILLAELVLIPGDVGGYVRSWVWELIDDRVAWDQFPWGKYVFQMTLHYLNKIQSPPPPPNRKTIDKVNYNFYGFPITIQVWAYEAIKELGEEYSAAPTKSDLLPRFLSPSNEEASMPYWESIDDDINSGT
ncbi:hypothetical protein PTKIN_Ptkin10aG0025200 [Pterospermum kingtungense]